MLTQTQLLWDFKFPKTVSHFNVLCLHVFGRWELYPSKNVWLFVSMGFAHLSSSEFPSRCPSKPVRAAGQETWSLTGLPSTNISNWEKKPWNPGQIWRTTNRNWTSDLCSDGWDGNEQYCAWRVGKAAEDCLSEWVVVCNGAAALTDRVVSDMSADSSLPSGLEMSSQWKKEAKEYTAMWCLGFIWQRRGKHGSDGGAWHTTRVLGHGSNLEHFTHVAFALTVHLQQRSES